MKKFMYGMLGLGAAAGLVFTGVAANAALSTNSTVYQGCVQGTSRTMEHVYTRSNPPACPTGGFRAIFNQVGQTGPQGPAGPTGSTGAQGPAGPGSSVTTETMAVPTGQIATGGPFAANATRVDTMNLGAGTYQVTVNFKAQYGSAGTGNDVAPQMFVYNGVAAVDFSNDLFNLGAGELQQGAGAGHDSYFSGSGVITVPSGGETLDFYAFGYDGDAGSGSYTLESATVSAVQYPGS